MWVRIIKRLLPPNTRISSVNMLGGRKAVTDACRLDQASDGRRRLYIIDEDFDYASGIPKERLKHLYRLRAYCVENILLGVGPLVGVAEEWAPTRTPEQISVQLDLQGLFSDVERMLRPLFSLYAIVKLVAPDVQTVKFGISKLLTNSPGGAFLDETKVRSRMLSVARLARKSCGLHAFRTKKTHLAKRLQRISIEKLVSGKDALMRLVVLRLQSRLGYRGNDEQLKVRLAGAFEHSAEPWFAKVVHSL